MMKRYSTVELRKLEIVNSCDGSKLGCPSDFEFEAEGECTKVTALIVRGRGGFFGIGGGEDLRIPWCNVQCIGADIILVRLSPEECSSFVRPKKAFWKST